MQIVLAKMVNDFEVLDPGAPDLGKRAKIREVQRPVALMWLNEGATADLYKALNYAKSEGYRVYTFDTSEEDPLGAAKRMIEAGLPSGT